MSKRGRSRAGAALLLSCHLLACASGGEGALEEAGSEQRSRLRRFWALYHEATAQRSRRNYFQAAALYRQALEWNPRHEESLYYLGNCLLESGEYEEALGAFRRLTELNPDSKRAHSQLALLLSTPAPGAPLDFRQARSALRECLRINPEESGSYLRLGLLELNAGDLEKAEGYFETAAGFRAPEGFFLAGLTRYLQGRFGEAATLFRKVLEVEEREARLKRGGSVVEGDRSPPEKEERRARSALERASLQARLFLFWSCRRDPGCREEELPFRPDTVLLRPFPWRAAPWPPERLVGRWLDVDADGDPDLISLPPEGRPRLYENREGKLLERGFFPLKGVWEVVPLGIPGQPPDLYFLAGGLFQPGENRLLRRTKGGAADYLDVTAQAGLQGERWSLTAKAVDLDGDGRSELLEGGKGKASLRVYCADAGGRFRPCAARWGLHEVEGSIVDLAVSDYDRDGRKDLWVLRWRRPGLLFRQESRGRYREVTREAGLAETGGDALSSLFLDYDGDGWEDLLVGRQAGYPDVLAGWMGESAPHAPPLLFRNEGNGTFREKGAEAGLDRDLGVRGMAAFDLDGDGWQDLVFACGGLSRERLEPSLVLRNRGGRFQLWACLPSFAQPARAQGVEILDLEGDSRPEIYLNGVGVFSLNP